MLLSFWTAVTEEGWSPLIWFCFQTTWCIRTIKISTSHPLIACDWVPPGRATVLDFSAVLPTLWGQVICIGPLPCLGRSCVSLGVCLELHGSKVKSVQRPAKRAVRLWQRDSLCVQQLCATPVEATARHSHHRGTLWCLLYATLALIRAHTPTC